jgi:hypothetical protein
MTPEEKAFQEAEAVQMIAAQDRLADYLQRGRKLAPISMLRLRVLYIKAEYDMAVGAPYTRMSRDGEDAEAELTMRGEPLPEAAIAPARELIREELSAYFDAHPEALADAKPPTYKRPKWMN